MEPQESKEEVHALFPGGLLSWSGHREGGIRKLFQNSGRPMDGKVYETELAGRLTQWASQISLGTTAIRAVLLVGGPGNGKTDAMEQWISVLEEALGCGSALSERLKAKNAILESGRPPRVIRAPISDITAKAPNCIIEEIEIIPDASRPGNGPDRTPEWCLLEELDRVLRTPGVLYLCCINRGPLAEALFKARELDEKTGVSPALQDIAAAVSQGSIPQSCWPLERYPTIAIWPMDAESLLEGPEAPGKQIFSAALLKSKWENCGECKSKNICPFNINREALEDPKRIDNLFEILRRYEIASGKRWTFRDIYSLVPELLIGNEHDFQSNGKCLNPCEWVHDQMTLLQKVEGTNEKDIRQGHSARFKLASRLYQHALFPSWPELSEFQKSIKKGFKADGLGGKQAAIAISKELSERKKEKFTQLRKLLYDSANQYLDPAQAEPQIQITEKRKVRDLDIAFSRGIQEGRERCQATKDLCEIDKLVLHTFNLAEDALSQNNVSPSQLHESRQLQNIIRQLAARFTKRSIFVRRGITKDHEYFKRYKEISTDDNDLEDLQNVFGTLINQGDWFKGSLLRLPGQPRKSKAKDVTLKCRRVRTRSKSISYFSETCNPPTTTPFLEVEVKDKLWHPIALTFSLFKALFKLKENCDPACLPQDVLALFQSLESRISGQRVRDYEILQDDGVYIDLLEGTLRIKINSRGKFRISEDGKP